MGWDYPFEGVIVNLWHGELIDWVAEEYTTGDCGFGEEVVVWLWGFCFFVEGSLK